MSGQDEHRGHETKHDWSKVQALLSDPPIWLYVVLILIIAVIVLVLQTDHSGPRRQLGAAAGGVLGAAVVLVAALRITFGFRRNATEHDLLAQDLAKSIQTALVPIWLGLVGLVVYASSAVETQSIPSAIVFSQTLGAGLVISGAGLVAGALLGFLFGVPKASIPSPQSPTDTPTSPHYIDNTNIEEISDWLTKIIVGLGLVQLRSAPGLLHDLSVEIEASPFAQGELGVAFVILFAISGFFLGYLSTRLFLPGALARQRQETSRLADLENAESAVSAFVESERVPAVSASELALLQKAADEPVVPGSFLRDSDEHQTYRSLRKLGLLRPQEGGPWMAGKRITVTALGKAVLKRVGRQP